MKYRDCTSMCISIRMNVPCNKQKTAEHFLDVNYCRCHLLESRIRRHASGVDNGWNRHRVGSVPGDGTTKQIQYGGEGGSFINIEYFLILFIC